MHSNRQNRIYPVVFLVIWMACGFSASVFAADEQPAPMGTIPPQEVIVTDGPSSYVTGTVVSSSRERLVVRDSDGRTRDFALDQHRGYGAAMIPGDHVRVEYAAFDDRTDVAKNVETLGLLAVLGEEGGGSHPAVEPTAASEGSSAEQSPTASAVDGSTDQMPATASPLPFAVAAGVFLFAAGMGVRLFNRG
jgi:hypothetical protein